MNNIIRFYSADGDVTETAISSARTQMYDDWDFWCKPGNSPVGSVRAELVESGRVAQVRLVVGSAPQPEPDEPSAPKRKKA